MKQWWWYKNFGSVFSIQQNVFALWWPCWGNMEKIGWCNLVKKWKNWHKICYTFIKSSPTLICFSVTHKTSKNTNIHPHRTHVLIYIYIYIGPQMYTVYRYILNINNWLNWMYCKHVYEHPKLMIRIAAWQKLKNIQYTKLSDGSEYTT